MHQARENGLQRPVLRNVVSGMAAGSRQRRLKRTSVAWACPAYSARHRFHVKLRRMFPAVALAIAFNALQPDPAPPTTPPSVIETAPVAVPPATPTALRYYTSGNRLWVLDQVVSIVLLAIMLFTGASATLRTWAASTRTGCRARPTRARWTGWMTTRTQPSATQAQPATPEAEWKNGVSPLVGVVSREGIEPSTRRLRVCCSAN